ncbi:MAG: tryptophan--tRNA ligase [Oscillospiraceae bacterium]|jgi:tryptophanyl-tRNA synthetase|nr:tryptophan--tRNA ligase [Oscillospiraceae bacterium]
MDSSAISAPRKRVLSLIQPTSVPTIGNYIGALRNWAAMADDYDCFYGVADLHALTIRPDPPALRRQSTEMFAMLLALGLRRGNNVVFVQSHVPEHCQLNWILTCYTQFGEAARMTQFKDKSASHADNVNLGLFSYPTLMAADILIYQADYVPIGADQKQHLELSRDIAERFNGIYGPTFTAPEPYIGKIGSRVMSLQDPTKKMSKSDPNPKGAISILDSPDQIVKKCKSAVTDSEASVHYAEGKDGVNNLMTIFSACTGQTFERIERDFAGKGYGDFKLALAEAVIEELRPFQEEYRRLMADPASLRQAAAEGAEAAARAARRTTAKAMKKVGLWMAERG